MIPIGFWRVLSPTRGNGAMGLDTSRPTMTSVGNYDLVEKIAEGGMGTVYKGRHKVTGEVVAVKVVPPNLANNNILLQRFENEFNAARKIDHGNVVRAVEYGHEGSTPYLVMEFVDGESLGQVVEREGRLQVDEAIKLIAQVAQGLHRAHRQGMIHRDVKPDNILVTRDRATAKLADLGLVKEVENDLNLTRTGRGLGTPHFMAPEQFRNAKNADVRCDIYSLGATLYQLVTGELPFKSTGPLDAWMKKVNNDMIPPKQLVPDLPDRVDWAIRRAMSANPESRPSTCREFVEDLTGRSTRKVMLPSAEELDVWYLYFKDEEGVTHTVKGTTGSIRRSLKEGRLGDASSIRASRTKDPDSFQALRNFPEFRDLLINPEPLNQGGPGQGGGSKAAAAASARPASSKEQRLTTPSSVSADGDLPPAIHIPPPRRRPRNIDWLQVLLVLVLVVVGVVVLFFFVPQ